MKKFLIVVPVILVAAAMIYSATKAPDRKGVLLPIATIPASAKSAAQPTPVANSGDEPNRVPHSTVEGEAREFPSIEPARDEHDQLAFVTAEKYFEYVSADSMWGMTAEEIAAWQRNKHQRWKKNERLLRHHCDRGILDRNVRLRCHLSRSTGRNYGKHY